KDALKAENARLETQLCAVWARQAAACGETLMLLCAGTCPDTLRRCCTALCAAWAEKAPAEPEKDAKSAGKIICAAIAPREAAQGAGTAYAIASEGADVREAACALNAACNGRGVGSRVLRRAACRRTRTRCVRFGGRGSSGAAAFLCKRKKNDTIKTQKEVL
ncbi:MAG: hypothetical protein RSC36_06800, partial [Ruthenibacterium sp.]